MEVNWMPVWGSKAVKLGAILTALNPFDGPACGQQLNTIDKVLNADVIVFLNKFQGLSCNSVRLEESYWPRIPRGTFPGQFTSDDIGVSLSLSGKL